MKSVSKLQQILSSEGTDFPTFDTDASTSLSEESRDIRDVVLDSASELYDLLLDPLSLLHEKGAHNNMVSLKAISHYGIAKVVPVEGHISFEEISTLTGLELQLLRRLLRHAMTMRIFREPEPDQVAHTKASRALTNTVMNDWLKMLDAVKKWPNSQEPNETGYALTNPLGLSLYEVLGSDPERAVRFSNTMKAFTSRPDYDVSYVLDNYKWASLGEATVVDVGGAAGHVAIQIAQRFSAINVVVQDNERAIAGAEARVPQNLKGRVRFEAHDFFKPQVTAADAYYLRWVLHNWSDKYCVQILRALIPALRSGARIVIQDTCMPEPGTIPLWKERHLRWVTDLAFYFMKYADKGLYRRVADLNMAALFNARERTTKEWEALLKEASPRFVLKEVIIPKGSTLAIIEAYWDS
ncbi:hypothetical protein ACKLNR_014626 [Fusarium oxysporum f. sp. zingiberi]